MRVMWPCEHRGRTRPAWRSWDGSPQAFLTERPVLVGEVRNESLADVFVRRGLEIEVGREAYCALVDSEFDIAAERRSHRKRRAS